jgi:hypothetical protein
MTSIILDSSGQRLKSNVENPAVEAIDVTWKNAARMPSATVGKAVPIAVKRFTVIIAVDATVIIT